LILCHPSYGKGFAAERVGQQMLQGFHLTPSACLYCLHDTDLEPTHVVGDSSPVKGVPIHRAAGSRTRTTFRSREQSHRRLCLLSQLAGALVVKDQTEVCPLARVVMFLIEGNPYPNDYRSAFACSVLLYPQYHQPSLRAVFPNGSTTGLPSSVAVTA
jgi:hypothetical protein